MTGEQIVLNFPLNPPEPVEDDNLNGLVTEATCGLPYEQVLLCPTTRKLLIRLKVRMCCRCLCACGEPIYILKSIFWQLSKEMMEVLKREEKSIKASLISEESLVLSGLILIEWNSQDSVSRGELERLRPDTGRMGGLETTGMVKGVILTLLSQDANYHFFSRYFAPW